MTGSRSPFASRIRLWRAIPTARCRRQASRRKDGIQVILLALTPELLSALDVRRGEKSREDYLRELIVEGGFRV